MEFMIVTNKDKKLFPALFTYGSIQQLRRQNFPIFWLPPPVDSFYTLSFKSDFWNVEKCHLYI